MTEPEREFAALREEAAAAFTPPPMQWFAAAAKRRQRRRIAVVTAGVAVLMAGGFSVVAAAQTTREGDGPYPSESPGVSVGPTAPSESTSPVPTPPPTTPPASPSTTPPPVPPRLDIGTVDWRQATVTLPPEAGNTRCPTGRVTLRNGQAVTDTGRLIRVTHLADGDLTRDGRAEAVLRAHCEAAVDSGDGSGILLVVTVQGENTLVGLGYTGVQGENHLEARVANGRLIATIEQRYYDNVVQQRTYRWNGDKFVQVAGPTVFPTTG